MKRKEYVVVALSFAVLSILSVKLFIPDTNTNAATQTASQTAGPNTISMSNSDAVAINAIPTSEQTIYSGTNVLSVTNSCPNGATVTLTTNSNSDTAAANNLIRPGSDDLSKTIAPTTGSSLNNNSWGYSINGGTNYYAVPAKDETPATIYDSSSATSSADTVNVKYGIKMDNNIPSGNYSNDVVYTVAVKPACLSYTLSWDLDGGTGKTGADYSDAQVAYGSTINLTDYTPTRDGYTFNGWSNGSSTFTGSETNVNVNSANSRTLTLTAQWQEDIPITRYIYNNGETYSDITGGYEFELLDCGTGDHSLSPSLYLRTTSDADCYHTIAYRTKNFVPISKYKKIVAGVTGYSGVNSGCMTNATIGVAAVTTHGRWGYDSLATTRITSTGVYIVNIDNIDEDGYVYVVISGNCYSTTSVTISNIYLTNQE